MQVANLKVLSKMRKRIVRTLAFKTFSAIVAASLLTLTQAQIILDKSNGNSISESSNFETISGNLPSVLPALSRPYLVTADVYVPAGSKVTIAPGAVILFKNFTGLHVEGTLIVEGSLQKPIVFSSEFDKYYSSGAQMIANPYDWNGIYIHENGVATSFANCTIRYSVFGINSLTRYIRLDGVTFAQNGRADCTIDGIKQGVTALPFSYAVTVDDARSEGVPIHLLADPQAKKRAVFRYGGLGVLVGSVSLTVAANVFLGNDMRRIKELQNTEVTGPSSNLVTHSQKDFENALSSKNVDVAAFVGSIAGALIGASGLVASFTF